MNKVIVKAKTVEEAIEIALQKLNISRENAKINIIQQPRNGLFGLFWARPAEVEVKSTLHPLTEATAFLNELFSKMDVEAEVQVMRKKRPTMIGIKGEDLEFLIGKRGKTIESLQYLVNLIAQKRSNRQSRILLDVDGYRAKREQILIEMGKRLAKQVLETEQKAVLEPMPANERRVIHRMIDKHKQLVSYSEGIEPKRYVVIDLQSSS